MPIDPKLPANAGAMHPDPLYLSALASLGESISLGPTVTSANNRPSIGVLPFIKQSMPYASDWSSATAATRGGIVDS